MVLSGQDKLAVEFPCPLMVLPRACYTSEGVRFFFLSLSLPSFVLSSYFSFFPLLFFNGVGRFLLSLSCSLAPPLPPPCRSQYVFPSPPLLSFSMCSPPCSRSHFLLPPPSSRSSFPVFVSSHLGGESSARSPPPRSLPFWPSLPLLLQDRLVTPRYAPYPPPPLPHPHRTGRRRSTWVRNDEKEGIGEEITGRVRGGGRKAGIGKRGMGKGETVGTD